MASPSEDNDAFLAWAESSDDEWDLFGDGQYYVPDLVEAGPPILESDGGGHEPDAFAIVPLAPDAASSDVAIEPAGPAVPQINVLRCRQIWKHIASQCDSVGQDLQVSSVSAFAIAVARCGGGSRGFPSTPDLSIENARSAARPPTTLPGSVADKASIAFLKMSYIISGTAVFIGHFGTVQKTSKIMTKVASDILDDHGVLLTVSNASAHAEKLDVSRKTLWKGSMLAVFSSVLIWMWQMRC